jgi:ribose transport system ATP-binding protein
MGSRIPGDTMTHHPPILEFTGITKRFGGITALEDVSFTIQAGEIHALVGENGAGKSTLIRICGGILQPDAGQMKFAGQVARFPNALASRGAGIGIVHQEIPMCPHLTAAENVFLGYDLPKMAGMIRWDAVRKRTQELFDTLQVDIKPTDVVGKLPIAMQQAVEIAQALNLDSKLLIMDEPTSALGKKETDQLFRIIRQLKVSGVTVIYVSHRLEEVFEIADQITALRDGRYVGTAERATTSPEQVVHMMVGRDIDQLFPKVYAQMQPEPLLRVRELRVPGLIEGVSFDLHAGEVLGLVGLQGAGASEVLRALFGCYTQTSGEIAVRGRHTRIRSSLDAIREGIAYVPADRQAEGLFKNMSVRDNAALLALPRLGGSSGWLSLRAVAKRASDAVHDFAIKTASIDSAITSLSGGNQQKVVIAKSLSVQPSIILLDDPTRGIDVGAKSEIHHILNRLTGQGCGVLMVSSELPEVLAMSDRVAVFYRGQIRALLNKDDIDRDHVMALATGVQTQSLAQ